MGVFVSDDNFSSESSSCCYVAFSFFDFFLLFDYYCFITAFMITILFIFSALRLEFTIIFIMGFLIVNKIGIVMYVQGV